MLKGKFNNNITYYYNKTTVCHPLPTFYVHHCQQVVKAFLFRVHQLKQLLN